MSNKSLDNRDADTHTLVRFEKAQSLLSLIITTIISKAHDTQNENAFLLQYCQDFASHTGWHTGHEFRVKNCKCKWKPSVSMWRNSSHAFCGKNPLYICGENIFVPKNICIYSSHALSCDTKGHRVLQYHLLWQNEQKKVGWIARVGQTTKEDVWEGQTTTVGWVGQIHSFLLPGQHGLWTTGLL